MTVKPLRGKYLTQVEILTNFMPGQKVACIAHYPDQVGRDTPPPERVIGTVGANGKIILESSGFEYELISEATASNGSDEEGKAWYRDGVYPTGSTTPAIICVTTPDGDHVLEAPFMSDAPLYTRQIFLLYIQRAYRAALRDNKITASWKV